MRIGCAGLLLGLAVWAAPGAAAQYTPDATHYAGWTWTANSLPAPVAADTAPLPTDRWLGRDKVLHAGGSFTLALSAHLALTEGAGASRSEALPLAASTAFFLGVMKEVSDGYRPTAPRFSWRDLTADALGVLLATGVVALW